MEGQPDMIPMPEPGNAPPDSFERKLTPDEERAALLGFMGNMYGEAKKMDGNIVGPTNTLQRGKSDEIKKQIEQVYTQPQQPVQQVQAAPTPQPEVQQPAVQAQQPVEPIQQLPVQPQIDDNQLTFSFDVNEKDELFNLVEKVLTRVDKLHRKVDEMTVVYKEFTETYKEVYAKKKSTVKKTARKKAEK
jgi:hypothetical protein